MSIRPARSTSAPFAAVALTAVLALTGSPAIANPDASNASIASVTSVQAPPKHVDLAQSQVGTREGADADKYFHETGRGELFTADSAWCAAFVSWVVNMSGVSTYRSAWVGDWVAAAEAGEHNFSRVQDPKPGDIIAFDWTKRDRYDHQNTHIGIVKTVHADGTFTTIEGNTSGPGRVGDGVWEKRRSHSDASLAFVRIAGGAANDKAAAFGDFTSDGRADLAAISGTDLRLYYTVAGGGVHQMASGSGYQSVRVLTGGADYNGDGHNDLIGLNTVGNLLRYNGNGQGKFSVGESVGQGWTADSRIVGGADFTGDGKGDLLGINGGNEMHLYRGNGAGFDAPTLIGAGWGPIKTLGAAGDYNSDGNIDFLAVSGDTLVLYKGSGKGSFESEQLGTGWAKVDALSHGGDYNDDGKTDFLAKDGDNTVIYQGNGAGRFSSKAFGSGWANLKIMQ